MSDRVTQVTRSLKDYNFRSFSVNSFTSLQVVVFPVLASFMARNVTLSGSGSSAIPAYDRVLRYSTITFAAFDLVLIITVAITFYYKYNQAKPALYFRVRFL